MFPTGRAAAMPGAAGEWLQLLFWGTCLAVALLTAALIIELVRRWSRKGADLPSAGDQLAQYRAMYNRGEISQEEFDRLRAVLGGERLRAAKPPTPPPANGPPPADGVRPG